MNLAQIKMVYERRWRLNLLSFDDNRCVLVVHEVILRSWCSYCRHRVLLLGMLLLLAKNRGSHQPMVFLNF